MVSLAKQVESTLVESTLVESHYWERKLGTTAVDTVHCSDKCLSLQVNFKSDI